MLLLGESEWALIRLPSLPIAQFSDKCFTFLAAVSVLNAFVIVALNDKYVIFYSHYKQRSLRTIARLFYC